MKRINDKILLDDKELKLLVKEGYDRGIIFGCKVNATKVVNTLKEMTSENFEIIKNQIIGFAKKQLELQIQIRKKGKRSKNGAVINYKSCNGEICKKNCKP